MASSAGLRSRRAKQNDPTPPVDDVKQTNSTRIWASLLVWLLLIAVSVYIAIWESTTIMDVEVSLPSSLLEPIIVAEERDLPIPFCDDDRTVYTPGWFDPIQAPEINTSMNRRRMHWYDRKSGETLLDWSTDERLPRVWNRRYVYICLQRGGVGVVVVTGPKTRFSVTAQAYVGVQ